MKSRWLGLALSAVGLSAAIAHGQTGYSPTPVGAARLPEPFPITEPLPPMMSGPLNTNTIPPGPPDALSLPIGHSSAFQTENYVRPERELYFHVGTFALNRQTMGNKLIAVADPIGLDVAQPLQLGLPPLINLADVTGHMEWGIRTTIGLQMENQAIELSGFYMFTGQIGKFAAFPGQIDALFTNAPFGFEGDNGLWLQADTLETQLKTTLGSGELNYRYTTLSVTDFELILGIRYLDFQERLDIITNDDSISFPGNAGGGDPRRSAVYQVSTHNRVLGPQIGLEFGRMLGKYVSVGLCGKAEFGPNFVTTEHKLFRGDAFPGFDAQHNQISMMSQVYELNAYIELHLTDKCRLRGGYQMLWLSDIQVGQDQIEFDLSNHQGLNNNQGSVFFHGPSVELQLLF